MNKRVAVDHILKNLKEAHQYVEQTMDGVTNEIASFMPSGTANPIAGTYAHLVFSEDYFTHGFLKATQPLFETSWKDKTGISELQPTDWETEYPRWLKTVTIDVEKAREYAQAVYAATEAFVDSLTDEDLAREIDMSAFGMPPRTVSDILGGMIVGHARDIMGEISVLKGLQGLKGYPF